MPSHSAFLLADIEAMLHLLFLTALTILSVPYKMPEIRLSFLSHRHAPADALTPSYLSSSSGWYS